MIHNINYTHLNIEKILDYSLQNKQKSIIWRRMFDSYFAEDEQIHGVNTKNTGQFTPKCTAKSANKELNKSHKNGNIYSEIEKKLSATIVSGKKLLHDGETVTEPTPIKLTSMNQHAKMHGVTLAQAQWYVDTAL